MNLRKKIIAALLGYLLTLVFLFPSVYKLQHLFQDHQHVVCKEYAAHFHEKKVDCEIHLFHYSNFGFDLHFFEIAKIQVSSRNQSFFYKERLLQQDKRFIKLRGPPVVTV